MVYAKKSLGQHFLKSEKALSQIIEAGDIKSTDTVLEIGPGTGILTQRLIERAKQVIAVEKDRELVTHLQETFADAIAAKKLVLIEGDVLKFNPSTDYRLMTKDYKLIANIPYYITGAIIEQFLSASFQPTQMVLLMQREVADRIIARPARGEASGKHSILSVAVQVYGTPTIIGRVPPGAFVPPPTVESAILSITHIHRRFFSDPPAPGGMAGCDEQTFFAVLKAVFGKKRKQIGRSFADYIGDRARAHELLALSHIDPKTRPEDMKLTDWKRLTQTIKNSVQL